MTGTIVMHGRTPLVKDNGFYAIMKIEKALKIMNTGAPG
jgi:hypothetical protein